jgi:hypothetical protein
MSRKPIMQQTLAIALLLVAAPAAAWDVTTRKNPMTGESNVFASANIGVASFIVACNDSHAYMRMTFPQRIGSGVVGVTYRYDDGPLQIRTVLVSQDGRELYLWPLDDRGAIERVRKSKRYRAQIGKAFFDFDLAKGDPLPAEICCFSTKPTTIEERFLRSK